MATCCDMICLFLGCQTKESLLLTASRKGDEDTVEALLRKGVKVNAKNGFGKTPLYYASSYGHHPIINLLIKNGANVNERDPNGNTPLMVFNWNKERFKNTNHNGANINEKNKNGQTLLMRYSSKGDSKVVKELINLRANVNIKDTMAKTALFHTSLSKGLDVAKLLLDNGANINEQDQNGDTLLTLYSRQGYSKVVKELINWGANVNIRNRNEQTALHLAASNNHKHAVLILLHNGADPNITDENGETPLHLAKAQEIVEILKSKAMENPRNPVPNVVYKTKIKTKSNNTDERTGYQFFYTGQANLTGDGNVDVITRIAELESELQSRDQEIEVLKVENSRLTEINKHLETELRRTKQGIDQMVEVDMNIFP